MRVHSDTTKNSLFRQRGACQRKKQKRMAASKTKTAAREALASVPVHPVTIFFRWYLTNVEQIYSIGDTVVETMPKTVEASVTVERLKGLKWHEAVVKAFDFIGREFVYTMDKVRVTTSKTDEPVEVSWSTLSKTDSLISWMFNNGTKLYLTAAERKLSKAFVDRNYTELVGALMMDEETRDLTKVYGSATMVKAAKSDIKDIGIMRKAEDERNYQRSMLSSMKASLLGLESNRQALLEYEQKKEAKKSLPKQIAILKSK